MTEDSMTDLERAKKLVRDTYREEIKLGLRHISKIIQKETFGLGSPIDLAFKLGIAPDIRKNVHKQIDLILDNAIELDSDDEIEILTNGNFDNYMKYDLTISYLRKRHKAFNEIKNIVKEIFKHRIIVAHQLLNAYKKGNFVTYEELARLALPNREEAEEALNNEIDLSNKVISIVKNNPDIIFAPVILQDFGLIIVEQLLNYGNNRKKSNLDKIYDNNGGN